ncbi:endo-1,3-beta glucanase [Neodidymelliopsis sp. IMI 364377]|nr:endo-1,3-beta glucanase [Neodidymelliopsis sp. IMI 364377]
MAKYIANQQRYPLYYDDSWKGAVSNAGFNDPGADFGNTYYNDHHFHVGYFVYTAAVIAYLEPKWLTQGDNKAWVNMLVKDFAESDYHGRDYPFSRSFDCWAKGLFESADGKDQESTSEDGFASYAIKMWGKVIGDLNMEKRGNLMLAIQARTFNNYFYLSSTNTVQPPRFALNKMTGILFENKVDYATYFGNLPALIHGIHMPKGCGKANFYYYQNAWNRKHTDQNGDVRAYTDTRRLKQMPAVDDEVLKRHLAWRANMIQLYNKWGIGNRAAMPENGIGPAELHRYPDNLRHTVKDKARVQHLEEKFPISELRLDKEAIEQRRNEVNRVRKEKEKTNEDTVDNENYAVVEKLPEDHQHYHAVTEGTNPWKWNGRRIHTSWESNNWSPPVASKTRVFKDNTEFTRPRNKRHIVTQTTPEWGTLLDTGNNRRRDNINGGWIQGWTYLYADKKEFELDDNLQRILIPGPHYVRTKPTYAPAGIVTESHESAGAYTARREGHAKFALAKNPKDELSDAEDNEYEDDYVPLDENDSLDPYDPGDDESDSDTGEDAFTLAYQNATNLPFRTRENADSENDPNADNSEDDDDESHNSEDGQSGDELNKGKPPSGGLTGGNNGGSNEGGGDNNEENNGVEDGSEDGKENDNTKHPKKCKAETTQARPKLTAEERQALIDKEQQRNFGLEGESFRPNPQKKGTRIVTYTHKFSNGLTWTQEDVVPDYNPDVAGGLPEVYPNMKVSKIPAPRGRKYAGVPWTRTGNVFRRLDYVWTPVMVLRKFRAGNGEYIKSSSGPCTHFADMIESNISPESIKKQNKWVSQYTRRGDQGAKGETDKKERWTNDELRVIVNTFNRIVHEGGFSNFVKNINAHTQTAHDAVNAHRLSRGNDVKDVSESVDTEKQLERGPESTRTRTSRKRAIGFWRKLDNAIAQQASGVRLSKNDTNPRGAFVLKDFKSEKNSRGSESVQEDDDQGDAMDIDEDDEDENENEDEGENDEGDNNERDDDERDDNERDDNERDDNERDDDEGEGEEEEEEEEEGSSPKPLRKRLRR